MAKKEKAAVMFEHLCAVPVSRKWSRLSLAVVASTLEALVDATPQRLGHTHLQALHTLIHPEDLSTGVAIYYTTTTLCTAILEGLTWCKTYLESGKGRFARPRKSTTLNPTFGDGSGTGTG